MNRRRIASILVGAAAAAAALWIYFSRPGRARRGPPAAVPIQDGKTIDFSNGSPMVKDSAADKAAMDRAVREMDAASKTVTFSGDSPPKK